MMFNFDSEENIKSNKIPSVKSINKLFCGKKGSAGFWVADENLLSCNWEKDCEPNCVDNCCLHFKNTLPHIIRTSDDEISGRGIIINKIIVLKFSPLIKLLDGGYYGGLWKKGDGEIKDSNGKKTNTCARRYLLLFLDQDNKPLHDLPLQLTLKGTFQVNFHDTLLQFRKEIQNVYLKEIKKTGRMSDIWFSMCVFSIKMESKLVGKGNLKSEACYIKEYDVPTEQNWLKLCVGRNPELNEFVYVRYTNSENWSKKFVDNNSTEDFEKNQ